MAFKSSQNIANDYKKNDDSGFELQAINIEKTDTNEFIENKETIKIKNDDYFIIYYYKNSELIKEIFKLIQFIILVGVFEYVFFTTIVNKYKIANIDTILCNIENKIL